MVKKLGIFLLLLTISLCACKDEKTTEPSIDTNVIVNNIEIELGMTLDELTDVLQDESLDLDYMHFTGLCDNIEYAWELENRQENNLVLGQNSYVRYYLDKDEQLVELEVVWSTKFDQEKIFAELVRVYGNDYDTINVLYFSEAEEAYIWDMQDGVSILWFPEKEEGTGTAIYMIYTDEFTAGVDASVSSN